VFPAGTALGAVFELAPLGLVTGLASGANAIYRGLGNGGECPVVLLAGAVTRGVVALLKGLGRQMPFWLKAVLAVAGVVIAAKIVIALVTAVFSSLFFVALVAGGVGVLWYGYRRFMNSLPAYKRRQIRNKRDF
jgi:hypothetical protein